MRVPPLALALLLLAAPALAAGEVHKVPQDHPTIQAAVDAAADGDTILISAGTYDESVTVTGKNDLLIKGQGKVVIDPPSGDGLTLDGCTGCRVEKIRVAGGAPFGFHLVDCVDCLLQSCRVDQSVGDGLRLDGGTGATLRKCTVTGAGGAGIALGVGTLNFVDTALITGCKVDEPVGDGIGINGNSNEIEKCTVKTPGADGLDVDDATTSSENIFRDCKVIEPVARGLVITGFHNIFRRCRVMESGGNAVSFVGSTGGLIENGKFVRAGGDGASFDAASAAVTIFGSKFTQPAGDGLDIACPAANIENSKVSDAGGNGCVTTGDAGVFVGNSFVRSGSNGILLQVGSDGNTLGFDKAKDSGAFDFVNLGANSTIYDTNSFGTVGP